MVNRTRFKTKYPELYEDLFALDNPSVDIENISYGSSIKLNWRCHICDHTWTASARYRGQTNQQCHLCISLLTSRKPRRQNRAKGNILETHPEHSSYWHPTKNEGLLPEELTFGSGTKVWWQCLICQDEWFMSPNIYLSYSGGCLCIVCKGSKHRVKKTLQTTHPHLYSELNPAKNENTNIQLLSIRSRKVVNWVCHKAGHEWSSEVRTRNNINYPDCPLCLRDKIDALLSDMGGSCIKPSSEPYDLRFNEVQCRQGHGFTVSITELLHGKWCQECESTKNGKSKYASLLVEYKAMLETIGATFEEKEYLGSLHQHVIKCKMGHRVVTSRTKFILKLKTNTPWCRKCSSLLRPLQTRGYLPEINNIQNMQCSS